MSTNIWPDVFTFNINESEPEPPEENVTETDLYGVFSLGGDCPDESLQDIAMLFFGLTVLIVGFLFNALFFKVRFFDVIVGIFGILFGIFLLSCSGLMGMVMICIGIMICIYGLMV
jgi:hypothetical protein